MTRRHILTAGATLAAARLGATQTAQTAQNKVSPNDRIRIATIGIGGMGTEDTHSALSVPGVELVAVCDLYEGRRVRAKEVFGDHLFTTPDYREILARKDIDAVIIGTADHWHAQVSIDAMNAGKDVYCEKPMVHSIEQGKAVIAAQQKTGRIMQVGSQRVTSIVYKKAKELIEAGAIGKLNMIEAWWDRGPDNPIGAFRSTIAPDASPQTIDWDRYIANTTRRPFEPQRFFWWRGYKDYGTGVAGDLFVHLFSGIHFVLGSMGPDRVLAAGGIRHWKDGREMPDLMLGMYNYPETDKHPGFNLTLRVNFEVAAGETSGFRFVGDEGILYIDEGVKVERYAHRPAPGYTIETFPKAVQEEFLRDYQKQYPQVPPTANSMRANQTEEYVTPRGYSDHQDHHRNFFAAVRSRKPVVEDPMFGFRAAAPALLSNLSYFEQKACSWDPKNMVQIP
jgi:predicted dehydrogenase